MAGEMNGKKAEEMKGKKAAVMKKIEFHYQYL
jgi:hypothetical protein